MIFDAFGRHLTRKQANRIYLIEDVVLDIKRFYEQQLEKELGNQIKSAQEGLITKIDLDAAIQGVKNDLKNAIKKIDKRFKTSTESLKKILTSDVNAASEEANKDCIAKTDAAINKMKNELMSADHLKSFVTLTDLSKITKNIGSQMDNKVKPVIGSVNNLNKRAKRMTNDRIRKICFEEDGKGRCAIFYPFAAAVGSHPTFYIINGGAIYIKMM